MWLIYDQISYTKSIRSELITILNKEREFDY